MSYQGSRPIDVLKSRLCKVVIARDLGLNHIMWLAWAEISLYFGGDWGCWKEGYFNRVPQFPLLDPPGRSTHTFLKESN